MKKYIITVAVAMLAFILLGETDAFACVAPLTENEERVMMYEEDSISLVNSYIEVRPASGYYAMTAEISFKNNGEAKEIMLGMPVYFFDGLSKAQNVSVSSKGKSLKTRTADADVNPEITKNVGNPSSFIYWSESFDANEIVTFYITLTVSTRQYQNGTQCIDIPLMLFGCWYSESGEVDILIDSAILNMYCYDRNPSIEPTKSESSGRLEFKLDKKAIVNNLVVYHNIDYDVIKKYFQNVYTSGEESTVADLFATRQYAKTLEAIESFNLTGDDFTFLKMVCLERLGMIDQANAIVKQLYDRKVCFSSNANFDISEYVRKRLIWTYYGIMTSEKASATELKEMLTAGMSGLSNSRSKSFLDWANGRKKDAENAIKEYEKAQEDEKKKEEEEKNNSTGKFSFKTWLKSISEPMVITVGVIMIAVVAFCIMGLFSGKKKKTKTKTHYIKR